MSTIRESIDRLRRAYPLTTPGVPRLVFARAGDLRRRARGVSVYLLLWAADGRVSLHASDITKTRGMSISEWSDWLAVNMPDIAVDYVLPFVNRAYGSTWNIERIAAWHLEAPRGRRAQ